ncbi:MAG: 16S rRNA (adenine(1518)-N(6)/adenine(1519)-N(6))-dimethyltransferase RsmA [Proteobacteria bacterium]|nr:16S rRNA (adenine(1518)-N(6)/adenine(1519)-N(6))-dimethyltransferase RsmA [Pseudomonadota bacterium]
MLKGGPRKALGQNFLRDHSILKKIISFADLKKEDVVVEIGAGLGDLTALLAQKSRIVVALELDRRLIDILKDRFSQYKNVSIVQEDALRFNYQQISEQFQTRLKVVGNIPYYLSTVLTMKLLKMSSLISLILFMFQREVAERITAGPASKTYGPLSILSQVYANVSKVLEVKKSCFIPQPKVDSALVKFIICQNPRIEIKDGKYFEKTLQSIFAQRRKTLQNALTALLHKSKLEITDICLSSGIDPHRRAETLSIEEVNKLMKMVRNADGSLQK